MSKKKFLALLLALVMLFSVMTGCKSDPTGDISSTGTASSETAESEDGEDVLSNIIDASSETSETSQESGLPASSETTSSKTSSTSSKVISTISVPEVTPNPDDLKATLPKLNITNKNITVCLDWPSSSLWVKAWVKALNVCYPGMKITWKIAQPVDKAAKLAVWKSSGLSPDAMYIKPEESWPTLINNDLLEPVDSYIDISTPFWGSARDTMNNLKISNKHYTLVSSVYMYGGVIYSRDLFKNAGLEDPVSLLKKDKWTWAVLESYAQKLTKVNVADDTKSRYGAYFAYAEVLFGSTGKDLIAYTPGGWVSNLNDAGIKDAINLITAMGPTGKNLCLTSDSDPESIRNKVRSGQIGMYVTAAGLGIEFPEDAKSGALLEVPIPRYTKSTKYYHAAVVDAFVIPKGAKNPIGGVAFANAVRAMTILDLDLPDDGSAADVRSTPEQDAIRKYALSKIIAVPMQFRRLADVVPYYSIWGPGFYSGTSYSSIVALEEPKILEELKKQ
ncbi:MAG: ABC transporter substrate-binding protein [Saccharofermentanales bacterium]